MRGIGPTERDLIIAMTNNWKTQSAEIASLRSALSTAIAERDAAVAAEREACAKIAEAQGVNSCEQGTDCPETGAFECRKYDNGECMCWEADEIAIAIRARSTKDQTNDKG